MDTKRLLTTMLIVGAVMLLWSTFFRKPPAPAPGAAGTAATGAFPLYSAIPAAPTAAEGDAKPQILSLGNALDDHSKMQVDINTQTAGIDSVQLNIHDYAETVKRDKPLTLFHAKPGLPKPFSTLGIDIKTKNGAAWFTLPYGLGIGASSPEADKEAANLRSILDTQYVWKVEAKSDTDVELSMSFQDAGKPLAKIIKTFHVDPSSYEIRVSHRIQNLSDGPIQVKINQLGPTELPRDDPQTDDRYFHAANYDVNAKQIDSARSFNATQLDMSKYAGGTKSVGQMNNYVTAGDNPAVWVAASNRFFTQVERPLPLAQPARVTVNTYYSIPVVTHIAQSDLDLMTFSATPSEISSIVRLTGAPVDVAGNTTIEEPISVFFGPKKRDLLSGDVKAPVDSQQYSRAVYDYISLIQLNQGGCYKYCTFEDVAWVILWLLDFFKRTIAFGNYGVAIMVLVIVVRAVLHPLTRASQTNMAKMGKKMKDVQPRIEAVKKKYAGNKQKVTEETMRIYREENVNPAGGLLGCLPMLIQMPIWAALWSGLRTDIDLRHAPFIPGWINDLSHPDTILPTTPLVLGHPLFTIPIINMDIYGFNLLPILLAVVFFFQMKVTTASQPKPADEQQAQMQKMSQYMIFLFPLFLYSAPSGLNLYIFASTMGGLVDTWLVRRTLKKQGILPSNAPTLPTHEEKIVEPN